MPLVGTEGTEFTKVPVTIYVVSASLGTDRHNISLSNTSMEASAFRPWTQHKAQDCEGEKKNHSIPCSGVTADRATWNYIFKTL